MSNAILCEPFDYSILASTTAAAGVASNLFNDEPGLIYRAAASTAVQIDFDLGYTRTVKALSILGLFRGTVTNFPITWVGSNVSNFASTVATINPYMFLSSRRTNPPAKSLVNIPAGVDARYWRLTIPAKAGWAFESWRILICDALQPAENLSIGAEEGIDDRSVRRYARNGRRVIDPTIIAPTFQGTWPWLTEDEYKGGFRPFMRRGGATKPALFALDPDDAIYGEDGVIYGDLEKTNKGGYDDGCYSYTLAIVGIGA